MSLVNQMLQDLEQRRTSEAGVSPLNGLSASGAAVSTTQSINYLLLGATLMLAFAAVFALIYLVDVQQSMVATPVAEIKNVPLAPLPVSLASLEEKTKVLREAVPKMAAQTAPIASGKTTTKTITEPKVQQPVAESNAPSRKTTYIKNDSQSAKQASFVKTEAATVVSSNITIMNDESEDVGTMSIVESVSVNADAIPEATSIDNAQTNVDEAVNKTIRPLSSEQQAQVAFQQAVKLLGRGKETDAQYALEKALSLDPVHERARETLAALFLNTGRVSEAAESLREGLRLQPRSVPLAKLYARVLVNQGDSDAAVAVMERARPSAADDVEYYALLAVLYRGAGKHAQAIQIYEQMVKARPGVSAWWMGLALSQDAMGESEQALNAYQRAKRAGGLSAEVLTYMQSRIDALSLSPAVTLPKAASDDSDGFGD